MSEGPVIAWGPWQAGPFVIESVPLAGVVHAAGFLVALGISLRRLRASGLPARQALEIFALGAPLVLLASRLPGLARSFPAFLHDGHALAEALTRPPSAALGLVAALLLALAGAWASRQPGAFLDALAPGGVILAAAAALARASDGWAALLVVAAATLLARLAATLPARARPGLTAALAAAAAAGLLAVPLG